MGVKLEIHPAAAIFPMMSDDELKELAKSITAFDLREKIGVLPNPKHQNGDTIYVVIDGRNRLEALRRLKIKDEVIAASFIETVDPADYRATPEEYVLLANIERRNLSQKQRRDLAGKLALMLAEQQKNKPKAEQQDTLTLAAEKAGVSRRTAATAKQEALKIASSEPQKKPSQKKSATKKPQTAKEKEKASKVEAGRIVKDMQKAVDGIQALGTHFELDTIREIVTLAKTIEDLAESKLGVIAERAKKEAVKIAEEAAEKAKKAAAAAAEAAAKHA